MNLKDLKKEILHKWRVQSYSKNKPVAVCVAYIDSRQAQDLLDEVCGAENWQDEYYQADGLLFCKVGIKVNNEWIWKSDTGTESKEDKEKGHSSDAFKRACVKWGIGRFLYSKEIQYIESNEKKTNSNYPHCIDENGKRIIQRNTKNNL